LVERTDILLKEEEALIQELASILRKFRNPPRSSRYKTIMCRLQETGAPFNEKLKTLMEWDSNETKSGMIDLITYCGENTSSFLFYSLLDKSEGSLSKMENEISFS
jgi:hypothetical protein